MRAWHDEILLVAVFPSSEVLGGRLFLAATVVVAVPSNLFTGIPSLHFAVDEDYMAHACCL